MVCGACHQQRSVRAYTVVLQSNGRADFERVLLCLPCARRVQRDYPIAWYGLAPSLIDSAPETSAVSVETP
jgi:hypothetical protein